MMIIQIPGIAWENLVVQHNLRLFISSSSGPLRPFSLFLDTHPCISERRHFKFRPCLFDHSSEMSRHQDLRTSGFSACHSFSVNLFSRPFPQHM